MTVTARRMNMGARSVITGKQLRGQLTGRGTHVGPNALLRSSSYPAVSAPGPGPLTAPPLPTGGFWRIDGSDELDTGNNGLCTNWTAGVSTPYVYNNHPSNLGGLVGSDMVIDGFSISAGTYVFQFMDLSASNCYIQDPAPDMIFRGCRNRAADDNAPGFWNSPPTGSTYVNDIYFLYCDTGGTGPTALEICAIPIDVENCGGITLYRSYISYMSNGIQPAAQTGSSGTMDLIENFIEKITNFMGDHLEAFNIEGGQTNYRMLRNHIVFVTPDENSAPVIDTACIYTTQSTSFPFTGTGTNPDGTPGYQIIGNYCGGSGYCFYWGYDSGVTGSVVNMLASNNLVTQSVWPAGFTGGGASGAGGGYNGPSTFEAPWGTFGNSQSNNLWADGPNRGTSFM
jgi:hypothetical protein